MSSCLCKKPEGAVFPFVFLVQALEDGLDDPIHAGDVDEAAGSAALFWKAAAFHWPEGESPGVTEQLRATRFLDPTAKKRGKSSAKTLDK
jgi:hypothetical protein